MDCAKNKSCQAGKGDKPRSCFSNKYRKNYELINWKKKSKIFMSEKNEKTLNSIDVTNQ
jgi:hypothetical protein